MARVQTAVTQTAEKKIKYRFACENCGHETDWIDAKITAAANATYKGYVYSTDSRVQNNSNLNTRAFDNLATAVQNSEEHLRKGKALGMFPKYKCPKCGEKQSWASACAYNWITVSLMLLFFCAGIGLTLILAVNNPSNLGEAFVPFFVSFIPIIIVLIMGARRADKRRKEIINKNIKSLEIDWLDGRLPLKY